MNLAVYARVSSKEIDGNDQRLSGQIASMHAFASEKGLRVTETYAEHGGGYEPGTRSEFARLLGDVERGDVDAVLTRAIHCLSRNPVEMALILSCLEKGKLSFILTPDKMIASEEWDRNVERFRDLIEELSGE